MDVSLGTGTKAAKRDKLRKGQKERETFEEERFMRVDTNQKIKKKRRENDTFGSTVEDLI